MKPINGADSLVNAFEQCDSFDGSVNRNENTMKTMRKTEIIAIVKAAMKSNYGITPSTEDIHLEMWNQIGTYIKFEMNGKGYLFTSDYRNGEENGVWTGKGTIEESEYNLR